MKRYLAEDRGLVVRAGSEGDVIEDNGKARNCEVQGRCDERIVYALPDRFFSILDSDDER